MGDVRVSKILVHPIKVGGCGGTSEMRSLTLLCSQSCRGTSVPEVRYSPEGLEVYLSPPSCWHELTMLGYRMTGNGA